MKRKFTIDDGYINRRKIYERIIRILKVEKKKLKIKCNYQNLNYDLP